MKVAAPAHPRLRPGPSLRVTVLRPTPNFAAASARRPWVSSSATSSKVRSSRPSDQPARYGGEEFAVVLPACQSAFGTVVAERIRRAVANTPIRISPSIELNVSVSIGGAFALQWIRSTTLLWIDRADHQLYQAKSAGRNRVSIEEQPDSTVSAEEKSLLFGPLYSPSGWGDLPPPLDATGSAY